jgi:hypothetical protein
MSLRTKILLGVGIFAACVVVRLLVHKPDIERASNEMTLAEFILRAPELKKAGYIQDGPTQCFNGWAVVREPSFCRGYAADFSDEYDNRFEHINGSRTEICIGERAHNGLLAKYGTKTGKFRACLNFFREGVTWTLRAPQTDLEWQ